MKTENKFELRIIQKAKDKICFDFFIDEIQLSKQLGFDRLENMEFSNFDLDNFTVDKEKFPNYNRKEIINRSVNGFLGLETPFNQFGTERLVLYRCHCGCDYCGVISCKINLDEDFIYWTDMRYENPF